MGSLKVTKVIVEENGKEIEMSVALFILETLKKKNYSKEKTDPATFSTLELIALLLKKLK